jgi:hypothetical protein
MLKVGCVKAGRQAPGALSVFFMPAFPAVASKYAQEGINTRATW